MSIRHKDKCTREEADGFKKVVAAWLNENKLSFHKLVALTAYEGEVRIYTGNTTIRDSRRKVLQKDATGYFRNKTRIVEKDYWPAYRTEWTDEEKSMLIEYLKNKKV